MKEMALLKTDMTADSFVFPERGVNQFFMVPVTKPLGFSGGSVVNSPANAGDRDLILGCGRSPGEGNDYPCQYSCLENPMERGAWQDTVHSVAKS